MLVEPIGPAACRSYLIACERSRRAMLVDPLRDDVARTVERLGRQGLELVFVVDTHTHADHHSGGRELAAATGAAYALHEATECAGVTERLRDGQVLEVGDLRVDVLHTPGHTPDSVTLHVGHELLTGDFLFLAQDGAGRLDLPGGDPGAHWDSLQRLARWSDVHRVLPGHDYQEIPDSTLGLERRRNPRFQNISREEYVAWQRAVAMPTPDWMLDVIAANLGTARHHAAHHAAAHDAAPEDPACVGGGACAAGPMDCVPLVLPDEAHRRMSAAPAERPFLLDVREPWEFGAPFGRHAPGAHLVPLGQLPGRLHELPRDPAAEVLVICKSGGRSARATAFLIQEGRRRVFNVAGGTDGWVRAGLPTES